MRIVALRFALSAAAICGGLLLLGLVMAVGFAIGFSGLVGQLVHSGMIYLLWPLFSTCIYVLLARSLRLKTPER